MSESESLELLHGAWNRGQQATAIRLCFCVDGSVDVSVASVVVLCASCGRGISRARLASKQKAKAQTNEQTNKQQPQPPQPPRTMFKQVARTCVWRLSSEP